MVDADLRAKVMADIVLLKIIGVNPVIVHGGGKAINAAMEREGLPVEFVDGQRVTTDEAMAVVRRVLTGEVNQQLVQAMNQHGQHGCWNMWNRCGNDRGYASKREAPVAWVRSSYQQLAYRRSSLF